MMRYTVVPQNVCPTSISFTLEGNVVRDVSFVRGCDGNLKALSKLVDGMTVEEIEGFLKGNICKQRGTSCADQLARAVREKYEESKRV
ncbi:MAG: TIGR03905 family TSCPD domain-containing protein [Hungatella sp.]|nr:TIGR03905 family TSCPD domain-containing protein [Hungatella sp.]